MLKAQSVLAQNSGQQKPEAANHITSSNRKQPVVTAVCFFTLKSPGPQLVNAATHSGWVFPPWITQTRKPLTGMSGGLFPW